MDYKYTEEQRATIMAAPAPHTLGEIVAAARENLAVTTGQEWPQERLARAVNSNRYINVSAIENGRETIPNARTIIVVPSSSQSHYTTQDVLVVEAFAHWLRIDPAILEEANDRAPEEIEARKLQNQIEDALTSIEASLTTIETALTSIEETATKINAAQEQLDDLSSSIPKIDPKLVERVEALSTTLAKITGK